MPVGDSLLTSDQFSNEGANFNELISELLGTHPSVGDFRKGDSGSVDPKEPKFIEMV